MGSNHRTERLSAEAVERAAAELGVVPEKLAEWLHQNDRLAHMLYLVARGHEVPAERYRIEIIAALADIVEFLEEHAS